jgi:lipoprotein NlpI
LKLLHFANIALSVAIVFGVLSPASAASVGIGASQNDWSNCGTTQNGAFAYNNPDIGAYYSEGDHKRAIADCTETIRLDPMDPDAHFNRGTKNQAKSDLNQIIVYYNAAISRDPKDDDAYFHRGLAHFYAGALQQAAADLSQASKLDPEYAFYALWMDIIEKRGNLASHLPQAISHINMTKWPAPVIRLFLGQATPATVLAAADDSDANTKRGQVCEANFYSGELALQKGNKEEAARLFRLAAANCPHEFVEGPAANAELGALGVSS